MLKAVLLSLIAAFTISNAQTNFRNYVPDKFYEFRYLTFSGEQDLYMSGADTAVSDSFYVAGFPIQNYLWKMSQANDSITVQCSIFVSLDGTTYTAGKDVDGSRNWASIFDTTAKDSDFQSISVPPGRKAYVKYISNPSTGDSALIRSGLFLVPRGE